MTSPPLTLSLEGTAGCILHRCYGCGLNLALIFRETDERWGSHVHNFNVTLTVTDENVLPHFLWFNGAIITLAAAWLEEKGTSSRVPIWTLNNTCVCFILEMNKAWIFVILHCARDKKRKKRETCDADGSPGLSNKARGGGCQHKIVSQFHKLIWLELFCN